MLAHVILLSSRAAFYLLQRLSRLEGKLDSLLDALQPRQISPARGAASIPRLWEVFGNESTAQGLPQVCSRLLSEV